jgi:hypothetical protein
MARWTGWWEQRAFGRQPMRNLMLAIDANGLVVGEGDDCIGPFTFSGRFHADGRIILEKRYVGRHRVIYEGRNSGEGIFGIWHIPEGWFFYESGKFALRPMADESTELVEIAELAGQG